MINDLKTTAELLAYDPLQAVEEMTGQRYASNPELSLLLAISHNRMKETHLKELGDSCYGTTLSEYLSILERLGFEQALDVPFKSDRDESYDEHFYVFVNRELGILLDFDTYCGNRVNGGKFYYCIKLDRNNKRRVTSSGGYRELEPGGELYWSGDHDCREAIVHNITQLQENGEFLQTWPKNHDQFMWMLHYMDTDKEGYDYRAINKQRIAMLHPDIQKQFSLV